MKHLIIFFICTSFSFAVSCKESFKYFGLGSNDAQQFQEIQLDCIDGYRFRVLSEIYSKKIIKIEDNKYLNKGKIDDNKKN